MSDSELTEKVHDFSQIKNHKITRFPTSQVGWSETGPCNTQQLRHLASVPF